MFPKHAKQIITAPIPPQLIQQRTGGGNKKLSYLSGSTIIDMLNAAFNYMWDWRIEEQWLQPGLVFIDKKNSNNEIMQGPVAHVRCTITAYIETGDGNVIPISKQGLGSKSVMGRQNDHESIFKAAGTDALKKAASLFGLGLELYRNEEEQSYFEEVSYEDPWTDELREQYKEQLEYIIDVTEEYKLSQEGLDQLVMSFSNGSLSNSNQIGPDNIVDFQTYIKKQIEAIDSSSAEE